MNRLENQTGNELAGKPNWPFICRKFLPYCIDVIINVKLIE
jgi:hypothetical protein